MLRHARRGLAPTLACLTLLTVAGCYRPADDRRETSEVARPTVADGDPEDLGDIPPAGVDGGPVAKSDWSPSQTAVEDLPTRPRVEIDADTLAEATPVDGGEFNRFFPDVEGTDDDIVFKQEKSGFAAASLQRDGDEVALLTINDLAGNAGSAEKFRKATESVDGFPVTNSGSKGTVALVGGRFQVQVRSPDGTMDADERKRTLGRFDLAGLAKLAD